MSEYENRASVKPPVVSAAGLSKTFRDFWNRPKAKAVNDIDFEVKEGEILGLLGPNGSGKSTTVKMLLGLLYPTAGRLTVFGKSPRNVAIKKEIGYLPEETYLYKYLTAMETLDFYASLFGIPGEERKKRCVQLLEMVGLSHAMNRQVGEFSKGMARRIGLAQAMINDPSLLILDEPTSGLDPIGCREVKDLISNMKQRGKTVIVTSHLLSDVEDVCDRVIILYGGKIRAQGALSDLLSIQKKETITTPVLPSAVMEKVLAILRENLKDEEFKITHPRMTLEDFFLDVVNHARQEQLETSGARAGGKIAEYLSTADPEKQMVLNSLTEKAPEKIVFIEPEADSAAVTEQQKELLENLHLDGEKTVVPEKNPVADLQKAQQDLSAANDKLRNLFSHPKGK